MATATLRLSISAPSGMVTVPSAIAAAADHAQLQFLFGTGDSDEEQPSFFFEFGFVLGGSFVRQQPRLQGWDGSLLPGHPAVAPGEAVKARSCLDDARTERPYGVRYASNPDRARSPSANSPLNSSCEG